MKLRYLIFLLVSTCCLGSQVHNVQADEVRSLVQKDLEHNTVPSRTSDMVRQRLDLLYYALQADLNRLAYLVNGHQAPDIVAKSDEVGLDNTVYDQSRRFRAELQLRLPFSRVDDLKRSQPQTNDELILRTSVPYLTEHSQQIQRRQKQQFSIDRQKFLELFFEGITIRPGIIYRI